MVRNVRPIEWAKIGLLHFSFRYCFLKSPLIWAIAYGKNNAKTLAVGLKTVLGGRGLGLGLPECWFIFTFL
jgi:hypothetical protein